MNYRSMLPAFGLLLIICAQLRADSIEPTELEQRFSEVQRQVELPNTVRPVQYVTNAGPTFMPPPNSQPMAAAPSEPLPIPANAAPYAAPVYIPPQNMGPADQDLVCIPPGGVPYCNRYRNSNWYVGLDIIPTQSYLTRTKFGNWPDDVNLALRLNLGYEDETGYGLRLRWWAFGQEADTPGADVDFGASTLQFEIYKRLFIEDTELVLGAGPAAGHMRFELPDNTSSRFSGGGISVFADMFQPISRYAKTDVGVVGRARLSLLEGDWNDSTGTVIPPTHNDSMSIVEAAWGLELRRRYGRCEEHYWYIDLLFEHQRWESAWLGEFADTAVAFNGIGINFGLAW